MLARVIFCASLLASLACGAQTEGAAVPGEDTTEESEGELRTQLLGNVKGIVYAGPREGYSDPAKGGPPMFSIGTPEKVGRFVRALHKKPQPRCPAGHSCTPTCDDTAVRNVRFYDASAVQLGEANLICGRGMLERAGAPSVYVEAAPSAFSPFNEPLSLADVMWSITSVELITSRGGATFRDAATIKEFVDATHPERPIDLHTQGQAACYPIDGRYPYWRDNFVIFRRKENVVVKVAYGCDAREQRRWGQPAGVVPGQEVVRADAELLDFQFTADVGTCPARVCPASAPLAKGTIVFDLDVMQRHSPPPR